MQHQFHNSNFSTLRQSYNEVKGFIEKETDLTVSNLDTKIESDLGCAGDDNLELLEKFVTKYKLNTTGFDYTKHFLSEDELFGSGAALLTILRLPFTIWFWFLKIISFGKINWTHKQIFADHHRETIDMTFGDMLTWYLTGKYSLRKDVKVKLKTSAA